MTASRVMSSPEQGRPNGASPTAAEGGTPSAVEQSPQWSNGQFRNPAVEPEQGFWKTVGIFWDFMFNKPAGTVPDRPFEVQALTREQLLAAPDRTLFRLGHSTV